MNDREKRAGSFVVLLFFLSGCSGLIYQVVWVRWLTMYVGGSTFAVGIVLTVFMAGLALGSRWGASYVDRIAKREGLVWAYGLMELGIGLYALAFPLLWHAARPLYAFLYRHLQGSLLAYNSLSALVSIALLIPPTALMGATLPFLSRYWVESPSRMGTRMGGLYGLNTIGAALGALFCGFWLIQRLGVNATVFCAAGLNILIGAACLAWSRVAASDGRLRRAEAVEEPVSLPAAPGQFGIAAILVVSGFSSMAYEVIWTKLISLLVGPTTYSFTVVLFTFITGLALGSLLFGWLSDRVRSPLWILCGGQIAAAVLALVTSQFLGNSQLFFSKLLWETRASFVMSESAKAGTLFLAMLPPTLFLGSVFPIAVKLWAAREESVGSSVGRLYAMNTVGALLGAFAAAFLLIPLLGQARSIAWLAATQVVASAAVALRGAQGRRILRCATGLAAAGALWLCARMPRWEAELLATAQYHRSDYIAETLRFMTYREALARGPAILRREQALQRVLFVEDGIDGFVGVSETVNALGQTNRMLSVSGKTDASSVTDMCTEALLGHIPMLLHRRPERVLVIGLASGITAGEMLHYPLSRLEIVEISPEVVRACQAFSRWNNNVLSDPRARVITQDARTHLTLSDEAYDVIVSEPSNPWMAGVANLFTREYFAKVRGHLRGGGVFVQWFHTYENSWDAFAILGRSLRAEFPNAILMRTSRGYGDCLFVCFKEADGFLDWDVVAQNLSHAMRSRNVRIRSAEVLANLVVDEDIQALFEEGPMHTDANPILEYLSPIQIHGAAPESIGRLLAERGKASPGTLQARRAFQAVDRQIEYAEFMASMFQSPFAIVDTTRATPLERQRYAECLRAYARLNEIAPADFYRISDLWVRGVCLGTQEEAVRAQLEIERSTGDPRKLAKIHFDLGNLQALRQDYAEATLSLERSAEHVPEFGPALQNLQVIYEHTGRHEQAAQVLARMIARGPVTPRLLADLAANMARAGDSTRAIELLERGDPRAYANLADALHKSGRHAEALTVLDQGLAKFPHDPRLIDLRQRMR